ncbi:hypothetical protein Btru_064272 [Bulinus truncatus]|nr:hypothetical protein Btru_064272 [Bulinus truncatus]
MLFISILFTCVVCSLADDIDGARHPGALLGAFQSLNDAVRSREDGEFQETLKLFESLLSGQELLGINTILGSSFLSIPANGINGSVQGVDTDVDTVVDSVSNETSTEGLQDGGAWNSTASTPSGGQKLSFHTVTGVKVNKTECVADFERMTKNITHNQWILPFLDSWGKPGPAILTGRLNFVGSYRQCRGSTAPPVTARGTDGFSGNYCVIKLGSKNSTVPPMQAALFGAGNIQIGSCMPDSCTESEITALVQQGINLIGLSSSLVAQPTECRTDERELTAATIAAM